MIAYYKELLLDSKCSKTETLNLDVHQYIQDVQSEAPATDFELGLLAKLYHIQVNFVTDPLYQVSEHDKLNFTKIVLYQRKNHDTIKQMIGHFILLHPKSIESQQLESPKCEYALFSNDPYKVRQDLSGIF